VAPSSTSNHPHSYRVYAKRAQFARGHLCPTPLSESIDKTGVSHKSPQANWAFLITSPLIVLIFCLLRSMVSWREGRLAPRWSSSHQHISLLTQVVVKRHRFQSPKTKNWLVAYHDCDGTTRSHGLKQIERSGFGAWAETQLISVHCVKSGDGTAGEDRLGAAIRCKGALAQSMAALKC
jgi:hypothetical protein